MKMRVQKWGKNLVLRIPKSFAADTGLREGTPVELSLSGGKLIVEPNGLEPVSLEELLNRVKDENIHGEWDTGPPVRNEVY